MLPTKLNSADVKGWARNKMRATSKNAVKAARGGSKLSQRLAGSKPPTPPPFGKKIGEDDEDQDPKDLKGKKSDKDKAPPFGKKAAGKAPPFGKKPADDDEDPDAEDDDQSDDEDAADTKKPAFGKAKPKAKNGTADKKVPEPDGADDEDDDEEPDEVGENLKGGKPGKDKAPVDDPQKTQQKPMGNGKVAAAGSDKGTDPKAAKGAPGVPGSKLAGALGAKAGAEQKPNTEPQDPMNAGGPGIPEELLSDVDDEDVDDLPEADPILAEVEEKLGDFAETLEDRADEIEELAGEVTGDLSSDKIDLDTTREVQQLIPDDLRQDLVEHLSGMSDEEIEAFCQHLVEINKISDPELVAGFLRAAASNSNGEDDGDDEDEDDEQDEKDDDGGESDVESDEDE